MCQENLDFELLGKILTKSVKNNLVGSIYEILEVKNLERLSLKNTDVMPFPPPPSLPPSLLIVNPIPVPSVEFVDLSLWYPS